MIELITMNSIAVSESVLSDIPINILYQEISRLPFASTISTILGIIFFVEVAYSVANCYWGYMIFRITLALQGFLTGGVIGAVIGAFTDDSLGVQILLALVIGIIGGLLAWFLYRVGVFFYCFTYGFLISVILLLVFGAPINVVLSVSLIIAILAAIFGVIFVKYVIIFVTAISSGMILGEFMVVLFQIGDMYFKGLDIILAAFFAISGILCQLHLSKKPDSKKRKGSGRRVAAAAYSDGTRPIVTAAPEAAPVYIAPIEQPAPDLSAQSDACFCYECGARISYDACFCEKCGTKVKTAETVCVQCGEIISEDALFCKCCGFKIVKT